MYQNMLVDNLLPIAPLITLGDWTFPQENTSTHASKPNKSLLEANEVKCFQSPTRSSDLDVVESL